MDHHKHHTMDHSAMDHSNMDHSTMDHSTMDHSNMDHSTMGYMEYSTMDHSKMDHNSMHLHHDHNNMLQNSKDAGVTFNNLLTTSTSSSDTFCNGKMAMNMDGFVLNLKGGKDITCINYLFPSITLDTRGKFVLAMIATVCFGITLEYLSKTRITYQKRFYTTRVGKYKVFLLQILHSFLGYVGMMIAMTYSVELLSCIVCGLGVGYAFFFQDGSSSNSNPVSTNPCCTFMNEDIVDLDENKRDEDGGSCCADTTVDESYPSDLGM